MKRMGFAIAGLVVILLLSWNADERKNASEPTAVIESEESDASRNL